MNDNIAKLLDIAEHYVDTFVVEESWSEYDRQRAINEKFAELLIKDCFQLVSDWNSPHYVGTAGELIKKHFGIE